MDQVQTYHNHFKQTGEKSVCLYIFFWKVKVYFKKTYRKICKELSMQI